VSRTLSARALLSILSSETSEVWVVLATLTGSSTIRIAANTEDVVSNAETYTAFPFSVELPSDTEDGPLRAQLVACSVDRQILAEVRALGTPLTVTVALVLASQPDTVEIELAFLCREISWDASTIRLTLSQEDALNELIPAHRFTPSGFPGVFRA
jgi:hypothetical protein